MNSELKWKLAFALLLVFVAGGMTGAFVGIHGLRYHMMLGPPHSGDVPDRMREHLRHTLGLTAEQEKNIGPIVDATSPKLETIRIETADRDQYLHQPDPGGESAAGIARSRLERRTNCGDPKFGGDDR